MSTPPPPPRIPNNDVPLNKQNVRAGYKEPVWKNGQAKEKETWEREKKLADDAIDEADHQNRLLNVRIGL